MSTAQSRAARMRKRLYDDLDALAAVEGAVLEAKSARERAQAALELAQADYDLAVGEEQDLQERSAALRAGTIRLRNSLQTMASFPSDLLVMIVIQAAALQMEDRDSAYPTIDWDAALAPYYATMVNQHWRRSVLSAARCWTYVVVPLVFPSETSMSMTEHLELALQRSRSLPMDVHLSIEWVGNTGAESGRDTDADRELYSNIFDLITGYTSRIRSLGIRTDSEGMDWALTTSDTMKRHYRVILKKIVALLRCSTPELVDLEVMCSNTGYLQESHFWLGFPDDTPFPFLLPYAPKLDTLLVFGAPILCVRPHSVGLPSLRTFALELPDSVVYDSLLWDTISMAPKLETLFLDCDTGAESASHPPRVPDSIPITSLTLYKESYVPPEIACPHLQTFDIAEWRLDTFTIRDTMSQTVTTLHLKDVRFDGLEVMQDLRAVAHACLTGDYERVDDTPFYDSLCDAADPMWPRLRHLELWGIESTVNSVDRDGLLNVVRARNGQRDSESDDGGPLPRPLEKLEIDDQSAPGWVAIQVKEIMGDKCIIHIRE